MPIYVCFVVLLHQKIYNELLKMIGIMKKFVLYVKKLSPLGWLN